MTLAVASADVTGGVPACMAVSLERRDSLSLIFRKRNQVRGTVCTSMVARRLAKNIFEGIAGGRRLGASSPRPLYIAACCALQPILSSKDIALFSIFSAVSLGRRCEPVSMCA